MSLKGWRTGSFHHRRHDTQSPFTYTYIARAYCPSVGMAGSIPATRFFMGVMYETDSKTKKVCR